MKKRKRWIWILLLLVVLALGSVWALNRNRAVPYAEDTAVTGDLSTFYNFSGKLEVTNTVTVTAPSDTTVEEVYVRPNDRVAEKARLMRLKDGTVIKADIAGEVTALDAEAGNVVQTGDELLELMDLSGMKATFQVDEYDIASVALGKEVQITVDGTGETFQAPVDAINKRAVQSGDLSYYVVTADLSGVALPEDALPGMQISVDVPNRHVEGAVLLGIGSLSFDDDNTPFVYMRDGKELRRVNVTVGVNDGSRVEITSGLSAGDTVLYVPTATKDLQTVMRNQREKMEAVGDQ